MRHSVADPDGTWDYVVVGGGSAGCVLANRLSEDAATTVLLLEAGPRHAGTAARVPGLISRIGSELNWLYAVEPDASRHGLLDAVSAGRVLGGSSAINAMMWVRGHPADYDGWAAAGCDGWSFQDVLPCFRRAERFEGGADGHRGGSGPQVVARSHVSHPMTDAFVRAAVEAGLPERDDYNGAVQHGVSRSQVNQRRGLRHSAADAYVSRITRRPNMTVLTGASVTRVIIEGTRAVGVAYRLAGRTCTAGVRRDVILSAGAIASPKVLMLSGVGPATELTRWGLPVLVDSPEVGQNLQDHPAAAIVHEATLRTLNQDVTPLRVLGHGLDVLARGRGAFTSTSNHAVAFSSTRPDAEATETELIFAAFALTAAETADAAAGSSRGGVLSRLTARSGGRAEGRRRVADEPLVTLTAVVLRPRGRGRVRLASADSGTPPTVEHDLLGDPADVADLTAACELGRRVLGRPAFRSVAGSERVPGPSVGRDTPWEEWLRTSSFRLHHPTSTCRMGGDARSVVDPRLRVRGLDGLRVVDASVMPTITRGNTNAPTMMIAERASDLIREDAAAASSRASAR